MDENKGCVVSVAAFVAVFISSPPTLSSSTRSSGGALPPSDFLEIKGQLVHLRDEGPRADPLPIVLIHGTSASIAVTAARSIARPRETCALSVPSGRPRTSASSA